MKQKILEQLQKLQEYVENTDSDELVESFKSCWEVHADGVKEVKCDFCSVNCGNDYCYVNRKEQ
jgi:hypothetical protein